MKTMTLLMKDPIYDVILVWNPFKDSVAYKIFCAETLCNLIGCTSDIAVKIVYEAEKRKRALVYSTTDVEAATTLRNGLLALEIDTVIAKVSEL